jgi:hypothetical protein
LGGDEDRVWDWGRGAWGGAWAGSLGYGGGGMGWMIGGWGWGRGDWEVDDRVWGMGWMIGDGDGIG